MVKLSAKKQNVLIAAEIDRLSSIFENISEEKQEVAKRLIERVAFMTITLQILEDDIKSKGPTYKMVQGSQNMLVENPAQKSYNTMINRYTMACDKLTHLLPKEVPFDPDDGFESFVNDR